MATHSGGSGGLPTPFLTPGSSSFTEFLGAHSPELLPGRRTPPAIALTDEAPHGTTIVALTYPAGVVMAGDRRATMGSYIAQRDIEKVFHADDYSCVGIAGSAGLAIELVRLFQVELEHYEKIEGITLSLEGKANRLATMIRGNLAMAMQGLAVVPLFAGYDLEVDSVEDVDRPSPTQAPTSPGRIYSYDVTGGRYEEHRFHSVGSGSLFARGALKKLWRDDFTDDEAVLCALQAIYDAADEDSATGGPDLTRRLFPVVTTVTASGFRRLPDEEVGGLVEALIAGRMDSPGGPRAPLQ